MKPQYFILLVYFFLNSSCNGNFPNNGKPDIKVLIQPLEYQNTDVLLMLQKEIQNEYSFTVYLAINQPLPQQAITRFKGIRYNASELLPYLQSQKADSLQYILGITSKDICITKTDELGRILSPEYKYRDFGIFGLGYQPGKSSVISDFRLHSNPSLTQERILKVALHELGHNLGLKHCTASPNCVMRSAAEKISTLDGVHKKLCISCKEKLKSTYF